MFRQETARKTDVVQFIFLDEHSNGFRGQTSYPGCELRHFMNQQFFLFTT